MKSFSKYYLFCAVIIVLGVVGYDFVKNSDAEGVAEDSPVVKSVTIPPQIEGLNPYADSQVKLANVAPLSIVTSHGEVLDFVVELAMTPAQQKKGLMFRSGLDEKSGMLFLFKKSEEKAFWMRNTLISLDMIFVRADGIIHHIHENAQPNNLERIFSAGPVKAVLELAGGEVERLGITIGDRVAFSAFDMNGSSE